MVRLPVLFTTALARSINACFDRKYTKLRIVEPPVTTKRIRIGSHSLSDVEFVADLDSTVSVISVTSVTVGELGSVVGGFD